MPLLTLIRTHPIHEGRSILTHALCYYDFMSSSTSPSPAALKLLPSYLGTTSIDEAIRTPQGRRILWLEILLNDQLDITPWQDNPLMQDAYRTACRWFTHYRRLLMSFGKRTPLPHDSGPIDFREYRTFAEAIAFVYAQR